MIRKLTWRFALAVAVLGSNVTQAGWFSNEVSSEPLYRAHESFLRKDIRGMAVNIKAVFEDYKSDETAQKNALALLEKAYGFRGASGIPIDWKLPPEVTKMKVTGMHFKKPHEENYGFKIAGNGQNLGIVKQLKVTRYPDTIVLDKQGKIGDWEEEVDPSDGPYFELDGPRTVEPTPEGLYLIHLELANGSVTNGWFLLSEMTSSDTPVIHTPSVGETFHTRNPTFRWDEFKSPEYKSHEARSIWMGAVKAEPPNFDWIQAWTMYEPDASRTSATVGLEADGVGVKQLADGRYNFYLAYKEQRKFGDLRLGRQSFTVAPFYIKAK